MTIEQLLSRSERDRNYYQRNRARILAKKREYYAANRSEIMAKNAAYKRFCRGEAKRGQPAI